jgi:hypothetical protein
MTHLLIYYISGNRHNAVVVYGDEQFVSRLYVLLQKRSSFYGKILPFPGNVFKHNVNYY